MIRSYDDALERIAKRGVLLVFLAMGVAVSALAQLPSSPPPPPLPLPSAASAPGLPQIPGLPPIPAAGLSETPSHLSGQQAAEVKKSLDGMTAAVTPPAPPPLPLPVNAMEQAQVGEAPPVPESSDPVVPLLLPLPGAQADALPPPPSNLAVPPVGDMAAQPLFTGEVSFGQEMSVAPEEPKIKTWETVLEPSYTPKETSFHYKRNILPDVIYRRSYDVANRHLPRAVTREDYVRWLLVSVRRNDVETTRALLNAGTDMNVKTPDGETPLAIARRVGAVATAELLAARGAH